MHPIRLSPKCLLSSPNDSQSIQGAMDESRAGHGSRPQPQAQPQPGTRDSPTDHISSLPDDLLLQVLAHLDDARAAARTTLLSRRWIGLFSHLPGVDVTLCDVPLGSLEDALRRAAGPGVRLIDIAVPAQEPPAPCGQDGGAVVAAASAVSAVLREATSLSPAKLRFALPPELTLSPAHRFVAVDLPSFHRTTSIDLRAPPHIPLIHSQASTGFPLLESLSLSGYRIDLAALIPRCPRLRMLTVDFAVQSFSRAARARGGADFAVQSLSLQGLVVHRSGMPTCRIVVQAPVLKRLTMSFIASRELSVSIVAPILEKVSWRCSYASVVQGLGLWRLLEVSLETAEGHRRWAGCSDAYTGQDACSGLPGVNVLSLRMCCAKGSSGFPDGEIEFVPEISKHMVTDFSRLELHLTSSGHGFGSFVWHLLGTHHIRNATRSLRIVLLRSEEREACRPNCRCDGPRNWRTQPVYLPNLGKLEIEGFEGEDQEFDFLKLVFRRARNLTRVTVRLPDQVTPNDDWCTKLHNIFMAYPSVDANVDFIPDS
ncbi:unnamed protein product [Alopecurus aequalis]